MKLLSTDHEQPTPTPVRRDLQKFNKMQRVAKDESRRKKARLVFAGAWLRRTEEELQECCENHRNTEDEYVHSNMEAFMEVLLEKMKLHHKAMGTSGTAEAMAECRRVCTVLGLLSEKNEYLVTGVADPLPFKESQAEAVSKADQKHRMDVSSSENEDMFITPCPQESRVKASFMPTDDCSMYDELLSMHITRRRHGPPASQEQTTSKKPKNTILK